MEKEREWRIKVRDEIDEREAEFALDRGGSAQTELVCLEDISAGGYVADDFPLGLAIKDQVAH